MGGGNPKKYQKCHKNYETNGRKLCIAQIAKNRKKEKKIR